MGICKDFFKKKDEADVLKAKLRPKYEAFRRIENQYDCGTNLMLNISSEASKLKKEIDGMWSRLQELDPSCPKGSWL